MSSAEGASSVQSIKKSCPEKLTTRQTQKIFRTVYRITRNREDAEDAVQDAFVQALKHFEDFDGRAAFSTWLTRIAINCALMILRKRKITRAVSLGNPGDADESGALQETRDPAPDAEQRYLQQERETALRDAIKQLRPCLRSVVELASLGQRTMREVAQIIGVSECAAKSRLFHGREALRKSASCVEFTTANRRAPILRPWLSHRNHRDLLKQNCEAPRPFHAGITAMATCAVSAQRVKHPMVVISNRCC